MRSRRFLTFRLGDHRPLQRLTAFPFAATFCSLLSLLHATPATSQYMYLDVNGDGVHTAADVVSPGAATVADIWLETDMNRDGTAASCPTSDGPLSLLSYQVALHATDGTISWGASTNAQPEAMPSILAAASDSVDFVLGFAGTSPLPPGRYKLCTITLSVATGTPSILIAAYSTLAGGSVTAFGSACSGNDYDNFLKLGTFGSGSGDWFDADGLAFGGVAQHSPVLVQPSNMEVPEGEVAAEPLSATDIDGNPLTFFKLSGPSFMDVATVEAGSGTATGSVRLAPGYSDAGTVEAAVGVSDGGRVSQATFAITVRETNRPPVLVQPKDMTVEASYYAFQDVYGGDPDGQPLQISKAAGPFYMEVFNFAITGYLGFIDLHPPVSVGGRADSGTVALSDGLLFDHKSFRINVTSLPSFDQPADMTVPINSSAEQGLRAQDADGDPLAFSKVSGPYFVTVLTVEPGAGTAEGLVRAAPSTFDVGASTVTVEVSDGVGSVQRWFRVTVTDPNGGAASGRTLFAARFLSYDAGSQPRSVARGDLDNDGAPDLIVTNADIYSDTVSVLLAHKDGILLDAIPVVLGGRPSSPALADFNGDGDLDMAIVVGGRGFVMVLFGRGDGSFDAPFSIPIGQNWASVAGGDLNGDGWVDIAASSVRENRIATILNNGDGTFGLSHDFASGDYPVSLILDDLDRDGVLDLGVVNLDDSTVSLFFGTGDGNFTAGANLPTGDRPGSIESGDFNRDGWRDLVITNTGAGTLSVFLGTGDGSMGPRMDLKTDGSPSAAAIEDFDGDGYLDLVTAETWPDGGTLLFGDGAGGFPRRTRFSSGAGPIDVLAGDVNFDGRADLITANARSATVSVLIGNGDGTFGDATQTQTGGRPGPAVTADFNADGRADLAVLDPNAGSVSEYWGAGNGTFTLAARSETGLDPRGIEVADLNGDARADLVVANMGDSSISVLLTRTDGTLGPASELAMGASLGSIGVGDVDGDGHTDIVAVTNDEFIRSAITILPGLGDGTFGPGKNSPLDRLNGGRSLGIADLNGDSFLDLFLVGYSAYETLLGRGDGTFVSQGAFLLDYASREVTIADLNQDGRADLAFASPDENLVWVWLGAGDGTFGPPTSFTSGLVPISIAVADFNEDGRPDLAAADASGNSVSVLLGNGGGTFGTKIDFGVGTLPTCVVPADLDGDGRTDLVTCDEGGGTLTVLRNRGSGGPNGPPTAAAGGPYAGVAGVPVSFDGALSSDPEGGPLTFEWSLGDGSRARGQSASHTYSAEGIYQVVLTASDGSLSDRDTTEAVIADALPARAFLIGPHRVLAVGVGEPVTCIDVEPVGSSYQNPDVIPSTIVLQSQGTGSVSEISAVAGKEIRTQDRDRNGVPEIEACFASEDLGLLFSSVTGRTTVAAVVEGRLTSGAKFRAPLAVTVVGVGGSLYTAVAGNPVTSRGTLTVLNATAGPVKAMLFDAAGRAVRTIADLPFAASGFLDLPLDVKTMAGGRLASGIYFYKVTTSTGWATGRITILR